MPCVAAFATAMTLSFAPPAGSPAAPSTADTSPPQQAERDAVVAQGRRYNRISLGLTFSSLALTLISIHPMQNDNWGAAVGMSAGGLVLASGAVGFAVAGARRIRHPERFMHSHRVSVAPVLSRRSAGVTVGLQF